MESQKVHDKECTRMVNWADIRFVTFDHPEPAASIPNSHAQDHNNYSLEVIEQMLYEYRFKHVLANLTLDHPFNVSTNIVNHI